MGYQSYRNCARCTARTKARRRCSRVTCKYGPYCWQHTKSKLGVLVRDSGGGRGYGLFAARDLPKGHLLPYTGKEVRTADYDRRFPGDYTMEYATENSAAGYVTDAALTNSGVGRYANDPRGRGGNPQLLRGNAELVPRGRRGVALRLTRRVREGREILTPYGPGYWPQVVPPADVNRRHRAWMAPNR